MSERRLLVVDDEPDFAEFVGKAATDLGFHRSHDVSPDGLADAFEDEDLEEDGSDEHDRGEKMQRDECEMGHDGRHSLCS